MRIKIISGFTRSLSINLDIHHSKIFSSEYITLMHNDPPPPSEHYTAPNPDFFKAKHQRNSSLKQIFSSVSKLNILFCKDKNIVYSLNELIEHAENIIHIWPATWTQVLYSETQRWFNITKL